MADLSFVSNVVDDEEWWSTVGVRLARSSAKGRFITAASPVKAGQLLWREVPLLACDTHDEEQGNGANAAEMVTRVRTVYAALRSDLPAHVSSHDLLLVLHAMRELQTYGETAPCVKLLRHLQSDPHAPDAAMQARFDLLQRLSDRVYRKWCTTPADITPETKNDLAIRPEWIRRLFGMIHLNSHRCVDATIVPGTSGGGRGKAVSLRLSMLEHNCQPNAIFSTEWVPHEQLPHELRATKKTLAGTVTMVEAIPSLRACSGRTATHTLVLSLHATHDIATDEPISISYYPCSVRTLMRQKHLQRQYGFTCACAACVGRDETRAFHCCHSTPEPSPAGQQQRCSGLLYPLGVGITASAFTCSACGRGITDTQYKQEVCAWEQSMRGGVEAYFSFVRDPSHPSRRTADAFFSIYPHHSHYLLPRHAPIAGTASSP